MGVSLPVNFCACLRYRSVAGHSIRPRFDIPKYTTDRFKIRADEGPADVMPEANIL